MSVAMSSLLSTSRAPAYSPAQLAPQLARQPVNTAASVPETFRHLRSSRRPTRLSSTSRGEPERCTPEDYSAWRRTDFSTVHAYQARQAFLRCIAAGEASVDLSAAALHIAAEDDALVSHSSVELPVASYQQRLQRMAAELARQYLPAVPSPSVAPLPGAPASSGSSSSGIDSAAVEASSRSSSSGPVEASTSTSTSAGQGSGSGSGSGRSTSSRTSSGSHQEAVLAAIQTYLYDQQGFHVPSYGRSNLPQQALLDHPGVWESTSHAYLNEVLTRKRGIPAVLAIILEDLVRRLLLLGAIDFAVKVECRDLGSRPRAQVLPLPRSAVVRSDGTVLNTCSTDALAEVLQFLKRSFWPFQWDSSAGSSGGFVAAARVFLEGEPDAAMQAISRTAKHRLERGIWTSPGAGDIRRALAASERLVLLQGDSCPQERRDLAVLLMHVGRFREAKAELQAFVRSSGARGPVGAGGDAMLPPALSLSATGAVVTSGGQTWAEAGLTERLLGLLSGVEAAEGPLTLESALREPPPSTFEDDSRLPLTW